MSSCREVDLRFLSWYIFLVADVRPLLGLRYEPKQIGNLSPVLAPPYDVISPEEQIYYRRRSPYNVVHLECGSDSYARSAALLSNWIREGILKREDRPAFYFVEHHFSYQGENRSCWGLICRVKLDQGKIRTHEAISNEPVQDRLFLLRACQANLSPVIGLFQGEQTLPSLLSDILSLSPTVIAEEQGMTCKLWVVEQENQLSQISNFLADKSLFLADGHHRYKAAQIYQKELRRSGRVDRKHPSNFMLMSLFSAQDSGLLILPVHRLVRGLSHQEIAKLESQLSLYFRAEELPPSHPIDWLVWLAKRKKGIGFYQPFKKSFKLLIPYWEKIQKLLPQNRPIVWEEIELNLLHWVILKGMLGVNDMSEEEKLRYFSDGQRAIEEADKTGELAFLLNPLPISQVMAAAEENVVLPRKSSFFLPKTPAGLVINPLWD